MKRIFFISLCILVLVSNAFSQGACSNIKIESAVVSKPIDGSIISATCSQLTVQWKGSIDQHYVINATMKDIQAILPIDAVLITTACDNNGNCTANIPVKEGAIVSWSVQASAEVEGRIFYSYPFRGEQDYVIPTCVANAKVKPGAINPAVAEIENDKTKVALYPNPVRSVLNINLTGVAKSKGSTATIRIFDMNGKNILTNQSGMGSIQINVSKFSSGIYFLNVQNSKGEVLHQARFVKE
ncbi:MAG: T9SS type A sorting domain-containing protein [Ferruginibacter sp.]